jgi:hypothetical protein
LPASIVTPALPAPDSPAGKEGLTFQSLITRLSILDEPVSREGSGRFSARGPGEYYQLQFRLIARGPEAVRLEIYDPFGQPIFYIISYLGVTRVLSLVQKKEVPFNPSLFGPWSTISHMPATEILKLFWGRVPLFPYISVRVITGDKPERDSLQMILAGPIEQELWITPHPFTLAKAILKDREKKGELEITFSLFSSIAGSQIPMQFEVKGNNGENTLTFRYETLILRPDIPDDTFSFPEIPTAPPAPNL